MLHEAIMEDHPAAADAPTVALPCIIRDGIAVAGYFFILIVVLVGGFQFI